MRQKDDEREEAKEGREREIGKKDKLYQSHN